MIKVFDHKRKHNFALKIVRNKKRLTTQGAVEIKVLRTLQENDPDDSHSIIRLR